MRVVVGWILVGQGLAYLSDRNNLKLATLMVGVLMVLSGACVLIGSLTPIASFLGALTVIGTSLTLFPVPAQNLFNDLLATIAVIAMATAITLLGPGTFSLDAYLFGRREIVIPGASRSQSPDRRRP